MNTVALIGRICHDLELKSTPSGTSVLRFTIAVDRNYQPQGKDREADFIDCVAWRNTAEFINRYFAKGQMIALTGEIQTSNYEKDGQKRKTVDVVVGNASFCGSKPEKTNTVEHDDFTEIADNDDLPF